MHNSTAPLVSICIPTYNAEATIRETLTSIVNQTYINLDIKIIDNASIDNTIKIVSEFIDSRITIHKNDINIGGEGNFNRCINLAIGKYTAIYHADDLYKPDIVQRQVDFLEKYPEIGAVFTEANLINEFGEVFGAIKLPPELSSLKYSYDFSQLLKVVLHRRNIFLCPSAMVKTEIYKHDIKNWNAKLFKSSSDLDVWLRISRLYPIGFLRTSLMDYRISKFQFSSSVRNKIEQADFHLVIDYYLKQENVQALLDEIDHTHYRWLERTDRIRRAINLFLLNKTDDAYKLCDGVISIDAFRSAMDTRLGMLTFLAGFYIKVCVKLRLQTGGLMLLKFIKKIN